MYSICYNMVAFLDPQSAVVGLIKEVVLYKHNRYGLVQLN